MHGEIAVANSYYEVGGAQITCWLAANPFAPANCHEWALDLLLGAQRCALGCAWPHSFRFSVGLTLEGLKLYAYIISAQVLEPGAVTSPSFRHVWSMCVRPTEIVPKCACNAQVLKYQELAAEDIRFNSRLADACYQDRQSFCSNVQPVRACVRD
eukprot:scaffold24176_cov16-Tisochrysis_lutea.AAC.1